jgi:hypothetical protein
MVVATTFRRTSDDPSDRDGVSRRQFLHGLGALGAMAAMGQAGPLYAANAPGASPAPRPNALTRIKMGTMTSTDLGAVEERFRWWLGYRVVERGTVSATLAAVWGTPGMAGRPYILMQPKGGDDVFLRAVQIDDVAGYKALTTFGWVCFEIVVSDVYAMARKLLDSPWKIIGGPTSLGGAISSIHAMQMIGPSQEVIYLTEQTDKTSTMLPNPRGEVGRPFLSVLGGPDVGAIARFYADKFGMPAATPNPGTNALVNAAMGLPCDTKLEMGFMPMHDPANFLEIDGYPRSAGARPRNAGQLPPGNAIYSFSVPDLDAIGIKYLSAPVRETSLVYGGRRVAAYIGPAGEIAELVEEPRATTKS